MVFDKLRGWLARENAGIVPPKVRIEGSYIRRGGNWNNERRPPQPGERGYVELSAPGPPTGGQPTRERSAVYETWDDTTGRHYKPTDMTHEDFAGWRRSVAQTVNPNVPYQQNSAWWGHRTTRDQVQESWYRGHSGSPYVPYPGNIRQFDTEFPENQTIRAYDRTQGDSERIGRGRLFDFIFGRRETGPDTDPGGGRYSNPPEQRHAAPKDYYCGCGDWRCPYN